MTTISEEHLEKIRHAAKLKKQPIKITRNVFVAEMDSPDDLLWKDLVNKGYAEIGITDRQDRRIVYFATEEGIRAAIPIIIED